METLTEIWERLSLQGYRTDKGDVHSYLPVYEKLLAPYRGTASNVLEIGLFNGNSMRMWREYFTNATLYGIDCSEMPHGGMADLNPLIQDVLDGTIRKSRVHIFDAENVSEIIKRFSGIQFDVIIEDAGHEINQQLNLYNIWSEYLAKDGIYIIEDIQDIDKDASAFTGRGGHVIDRRKEKSRYDDVIVIFEDPAKIQRP